MLKNINSRIEIKYYIDDKLVEDVISKFQIHHSVYIVKKKRRKIYVIKDEITSVSFTNMISYKTSFNGFFTDSSKSIFNTKEDAYLYAEKMNSRKNIKYKEFS